MAVSDKRVGNKVPRHSGAQWADESEIKPMQEAINLLRRHMENILAYFYMPISNEIDKGLNNKANEKPSGLRTPNVKNFIK